MCACIRTEFRMHSCECRPWQAHSACLCERASGDGAAPAEAGESTDEEMPELEPIDEDNAQLRLRLRHELEGFMGAVRAAGAHITMDLSAMGHVARMAEQGPEAANGLHRRLSRAVSASRAPSWVCRFCELVPEAPATGDRSTLEPTVAAAQQE